MNDDDFLFYQKLLREASGLFLTPDKTYLLAARLEPLAKKMGLKGGLDELSALLRGKHDSRAADLVVQAMTTQETLFFRDMAPFLHLRKTIFPALAEAKGVKVIRVLSAGCSTGQETYSIAIVAREFLRNHPGWTVQILAIDIAEDALALAREGVYSQFDIQRGLSMKLVLEHFTYDHTRWRASEDLRQMIRFAKANLLHPLEALGKFDIIFCRNVLIYFDNETKKTVLDRLINSLQPRGFLLLGACETAIGISTRVKPSPGMPGVLIPAASAPAKQNEVNE